MNDPDSVEGLAAEELASLIFGVSRVLLKGEGKAGAYLNERPAKLMVFTKEILGPTWDAFKYFIRDAVRDQVSSGLIEMLSLMSKQRMEDVFESALLGGRYTEQLMELVVKEAGCDLDIFETLLRTGSLLNEWLTLDPSLGIVGPGISSLFSQTRGDRYVEVGSLARITRTLRTLATAS